MTNDYGSLNSLRSAKEMALQIIMFNALSFLSPFLVTDISRDLRNVSPCFCCVSLVSLADASKHTNKYMECSL